MVVAGQSIESLMNSGNMLLQNGAYDQAVTKFRKVLSRDPGNFEAQFNLAFAYLNWGRHSSAVEELKKTLGINPRCAECWSNLALAFEALGQSDQALNALYKSVSVNPGNIEARTNLATMYVNYDRLSDAISQYKQVIQIDGSNVDAHVNLAKCLIAEGRIEEAKHYLNSALALNPNEAEAHWELGNIAWKKEDDKQQALEKYQKAISIEPNTHHFYEKKALLHEEMGDKEKALATWKKSMVYIDDALRKDEIQYRIDMLERGEAPSGKETPEALFGKNDKQKEDVERLRSELGREEDAEAQSPTLITTQSLDVSGDMDELQEESESQFDFDVKKAVKKKIREKEK
jgi:tetratricopeptide (TPR) repeat protein